MPLTKCSDSTTGSNVSWWLACSSRWRRISGISSSAREACTTKVPQMGVGVLQLCALTFSIEYRSRWRKISGISNSGREACAIWIGRWVCACYSYANWDFVVRMQQQVMQYFGHQKLCQGILGGGDVRISFWWTAITKCSKNLKEAFRSNHFHSRDIIINPNCQ